MEKSSLRVMGYDVFNSRLDKVNYATKTLINTISPNSYGLAQKDKELENALKNTDLLVLDGVGIALGAILIHGKNIKKIAGQDCFDFFTAMVNKQGGKCFFMGSSTSTLTKIKDRMKIDYPNIEVGTYSPPFKDKFSNEENAAIVSAINEFAPDVLFIGLTAPKQEKWAYEHKTKVNANIIVTIGNVFDWYAGNSKRPGKIWITLRLEWLVRIFLRPQIFRRNTGNQMVYLWHLLLHLTKIKRR